jgi:hypothetical protein
LGEVTKANHNECSDDLGDGWINVKILYQYFQTYIVDKDANHYQ